jgi:hypothetical protein
MKNPTLKEWKAYLRDPATVDRLVAFWDGGDDDTIGMSLELLTRLEGSPVDSPWRALRLLYHAAFELGLLESWEADALAERPERQDKWHQDRAELECVALGAALRLALIEPTDDVERAMRATGAETILRTRRGASVLEAARAAMELL